MSRADDYVDQVLDDPACPLSRNARAVLRELGRYAGQNGRAWPSWKALGRRTGLKRTAVSDALAEIAREHYATRVKAGGGRDPAEWIVPGRPQLQLVDSGLARPPRRTSPVRHGGPHPSAVADPNTQVNTQLNTPSDPRERLQPVSTGGAS